MCIQTRYTQFPVVSLSHCVRIRTLFAFTFTQRFWLRRCSLSPYPALLVMFVFSAAGSSWTIDNIANLLFLYRPGVTGYVRVPYDVGRSLTPRACWATGYETSQLILRPKPKLTISVTDVKTTFSSTLSTEEVKTDTNA